jgi:hypothetical protein
MSGRHALPTVRSRVTTIVLMSILAAGCGSAAPSVASVPPSSSTPVASLGVGASSIASPAPTAGGPTPFAAWIERQGFGGSSGLNNVVKLIHFVAERPGEETTFNIDDETSDIEGLVTWLDSHPATPCWADYHAAVRSSLTKVLAAYAIGRKAVETGLPFPADVAASMVAEADQVLAVAGPTDCP